MLLISKVLIQEFPLFRLHPAPRNPIARNTTISDKNLSPHEKKCLYLQPNSGIILIL